jgi:protein required for attachment to host cells
MPVLFRNSMQITGGRRMRVNRTFSIPVDLVHDLRKKHNQSETVTRALRKYLDNQGESSIESASTRQLMAALLARNDIDETMKALLLQILTK